MSVKVALAEIRIHSYGSKAIIGENNDGTWSVGLIISPANVVFAFTKSSNKEAKEFADIELSKFHTCCALCGNWEVFTRNASEILEFSP